MKQTFKLILILMLIVASYAPGSFITPDGAKAAGNTYYVATTGNDSFSGAPGQPFRTISHAYSLANPGDTIIVKPGTYTDFTSSFSGLVFDRAATSANPITIKSEQRGQAIIDGQNNSGRREVITFYGSYNILNGFVITNGYEGGIFVGGFNNQIINNEISYNANAGDNTSNYGEDGVYSDHDSYGTQYINNYIHHNGRLNLPNNNLDHGMYLCGDGELIQNNIITNNMVMGLQIAGYTTVQNMKVYNNTIVNNGSDGIKVWRDLDNVDIRNNIIVNNAGSGIGSYDAHGSGVYIDHNLIYGNAGNFDPSTLSDFTYTYVNTISANPLFFSSTDFNLQSSSPAKDTGLSLGAPYNFDIAGATRPIGPGYDIGAFETTGAATPPPPPSPQPTPPPSALPNTITQSQLKIMTASTDVSNASLVVDGDLDTKWLSSGGFPQEVVTYLGGSYTVTGMSYTSNGWTGVNTYEVYVSADGTNWSTPVASGTMPANGIIPFTGKSGRYVKFKTLSSTTGGTYAYVSELNAGGSALNPILGDMNLDHIVNSIDFSLLNVRWFGNDPGYDFNSDGLVNSLDYSALNSNWFKTW